MRRGEEEEMVRERRDEDEREGEGEEGRQREVKEGRNEATWREEERKRSKGITGRRC